MFNSSKKNLVLTAIFSSAILLTGCGQDKPAPAPEQKTETPAPQQTEAPAAQPDKKAGPAVAADNFAIGKVSPGMSREDLIKAVGEPKSKSADGEEWFYDDFKVEFDDDRPGVVDKVSTTGDKVQTPNGVAVGQSSDVLKEKFGEPAKIDEDPTETEMTFYSPDNKKEIEFEVAGGKIGKITCKIRD